MRQDKTEVARVHRSDGGYRVRRWLMKSAVKVWGSTIKLRLKLVDLSIFEVGGMRGVAVKCIEITQNSDCEGSLLNYN